MSDKDLLRRIKSIEEFLGIAYVKSDGTESYDDSYHVVDDYGLMKWLKTKREKLEDIELTSLSSKLK